VSGGGSPQRAQSAQRRHRFDPITFQVLWSRLNTIADEVATTLVKTAFSHVVRDNHDYACALYDAEGRMLAQAAQCTPGQLGAMPLVVRDFLKAYPAETLAPGDVLITNDPWLGCGHTPDIYIATPIFRDERLVGFSVNSAHHIDVGGRMSAPEAREVYEEGIILPICKLFSRGVPNDDLFRILRRNVRLADKVLGDIRAQLAANHAGARGIVELLEERRLDTLSDLAEQIIAHTEASMRAAIAEVPDGTYAHEVELEEAGRAGQPIRIQVRVEVKGDEVAVDFTGTSAQVDRPINSVYNITYAYTVFPLKCALHPHIPNNEGCFGPVRLTVPEGSVLTPRFPAACLWRTSLVYYVVEPIFGALAQAIPHRVLAPSGTYPLALEIFAGAFDDGRPFVVHYNFQGGQGARHDRDGLSTMVFPANVASTPTELLETEAPLLCERKVLLQDSGGPGRYRGGCGQEAVIRSLARQHVVVSVVGGRFRRGAEGLHGGRAGATGQVLVNDREPLTQSRQLLLQRGDFLRFRLPGGGGFGHPFERDADLVLQDVRRGLVSPERAREDYGVALGPSLSEIDPDETARLRGTCRLS
jgi:N-methylhydantoinase B